MLPPPSPPSPLPVPTRVRGLSGGARSLAENGRCARSPRPPPPSAAPGTALERLQPRARPTHAPTRRPRCACAGGSSAPGPGRRRRCVLVCSGGESPREFSFLYHLLNIDPPGRAGGADFALTSHPAGGVCKRGAQGEPRDTPPPRARTAAVRRRERGIRARVCTQTDTHTHARARAPRTAPPAARPARAVTSPKGQPACSHTHRGPLPEPQFLPGNMRGASVRTPLPHRHSAWETPVQLAVLAPRAVTPGGRVEWSQRPNHSRNFSLLSQVYLVGAGGVAWGRTPPRIPSEWTRDVTAGLASRRTWVWPRHSHAHHLSCP